MSVTGEDFQPQRLQAYYRLQARVYDASRWAFLFGRSALVDQVARLEPERVLEVGCGTGFVLDRLARKLPHAQLVGIDLSEDMLSRAGRRLGRHAGRVELRRELFGDGTVAADSCDAVVFSYALTMMGGARNSVLDAAWQALRPGGQLAVVDFDASSSTLFRRWMAVNHVDIDGQLPGQLARRFELQTVRSVAAYGGLWRWCLLLGRKPELSASAVPN